MKKILVLFTLAIAVIFIDITETSAQSKKKGPPDWAPAHGYRAQTKNIYFPDNNFYYNIEKGTYIYLDGGSWQISAKLPSLFSGIDLNLATKIELDVDTDSPQKYNADHVVKYKGNSKNSKPKNNPGKGNKK